MSENKYPVIEDVEDYPHSPEVWITLSEGTKVKGYYNYEDCHWFVKQGQYFTRIDDEEILKWSYT